MQWWPLWTVCMFSWCQEQVSRPIFALTNSYYIFPKTGFISQRFVTDLGRRSVPQRILKGLDTVVAHAL